MRFDDVAGNIWLSPTASTRSASTKVLNTCTSSLKRRKLKLKANFEGGPSYYSFKRLVPGALNMGLTGSSCTSLPRWGPASRICGCRTPG